MRTLQTAWREVRVRASQALGEEAGIMPTMHTVDIADIGDEGVTLA